MKIFTGKVVSTKMAKTATVSVTNTFMHRLYGKRYARSKKYQVHDRFSCKVGEIVNFVACKPYSKTKKWEIIKAEDHKSKSPKKDEKPVQEKVVVVKTKSRNKKS